MKTVNRAGSKSAYSKPLANGRRTARKRISCIEERSWRLWKRILRRTLTYCRNLAERFSQRALPSGSGNMKSGNSSRGVSSKMLGNSQRHRAQEKGKALRRQRFFIIALGVLLFIAALVAVFAAQQWISARANEKTARANEKKALEAASRADVSLARELKQAGD